MRPRRRVLDVREHDRELVPAETGYDILRPDRVPEPAGDGDEQRVADAVAERVVDHLEVVHVDEEHRRSSPSPVASSLADALHEQRPVGQVGKRIVVGLVVELLLERGAA